MSFPEAAAAAAAAADETGMRLSSAGDWGRRTEMELNKLMSKQQIKQGI
jgi:hypothetical protein